MTAIVCPHCAAENRATAKYCTSCAKLMVNLETGELLPRKKHRSRHKSKSKPRDSGLRRVAPWLLILTVVGLGVAWWALTQDAARHTAHEQDMAGHFEAPTNMALPEEEALGNEPQLASFPAFVPVIAPIASTDVAASSSPTPDAPRSTAKPPAPAPMDKGRAKPRPKEPVGQNKIAEPAAPPRQVATASAAAAPAQPEPPRPTPEQACSGTAFLSRAACMQKQCASNPSHPQCQALRETQDALKRGSGGG